MNKRRLLKLAGLLEADAKNPNGVKFNLALFGEDLTKGAKPLGAHCGTTACAMGLAALSGAFKRQGLTYEVEHYVNCDLPSDIVVICNGARHLEAAEKLFGIDYDTAEWLFTPEHYTNKPTKGATGERAVAKRIRDFVAGKATP